MKHYTAAEAKYAADLALLKTYRDELQVFWQSMQPTIRTAAAEGEYVATQTAPEDEMLQRAAKAFLNNLGYKASVSGKTLLVEWSHVE